MCFVWISEQKAIISLYNINWLVSITETECIYCAVRTENIEFHVLPTQCVCFVWISEQTAIISLYNINWLVSITETESGYCAVRTENIEFHVLPTQCIFVFCVGLRTNSDFFPVHRLHNCERRPSCRSVRIEEVGHPPPTWRIIMIFGIWAPPVALRPNAGQDLLILDVSRSHTTTHHSR